MGNLISRQAAIDAIHEDADWLAVQGSDWQEERMERDKSILMSLPSAQPERCEDCRNFNKARLLITQPDMSEYSDRLWRNAYERGKKDGQSEIVRCRECKWHDGVRCFRWNSTIITGLDDFCSNGERRQDG